AGGAGGGVRGGGDDRNVTRGGIVLQPPRRLPAVDDRELEIHHDHVGLLGRGLGTSDLAVLGHQHLELVEQLEPHLEHVDVVVVVFDVEDSYHGTRSRGGAWPGSEIRRRMRSTSSAGRNVSLSSTVWTPEFSRSRSAAVRSRAVTTMTGMSCRAGSSCILATSWNPSMSGIIRSSRMRSGASSRRRSS